MKIGNRRDSIRVVCDGSHEVLEVFAVCPHLVHGMENGPGIAGHGDKRVTVLEALGRSPLLQLNHEIVRFARG